MTGEEYIASAFEYPASYGKTCQDGIYRISTGKGISAEVSNRTWYGDKLEDIIEFYKEKLKVYNAEGKEYQPDGENSWGYNRKPIIKDRQFGLKLFRKVMDIRFSIG